MTKKKTEDRGEEGGSGGEREREVNLRLANFKHFVGRRYWKEHPCAVLIALTKHISLHITWPVKLFFLEPKEV